MRVVSGWAKNVVTRTRVGAANPRLMLIVATLVSQGSSFVVGKVVAVTYGPSGVGYQGAVTSAAIVAAGVALLGISNALPSYAAQQSHLTQRQVAHAAAIIVMLPAVIATSVACFAVVGTLTPQFNLAVAVGALVTAIAASLAVPLQNTLVAVYRGPRWVALQQVSTSVVSAIAIVVGLAFLAYDAFPLVIGGGLLTGAIVGGATVRVVARARRKDRDSANTNVYVVNTLLKASLAKFSSVSLGQFAYSAIPLVVFMAAGPDEGGLFRSAFSWGILVVTQIASTITYQFYPEIARRIASADVAEVTAEAEVRATVRLPALAALALSVVAPVLMIAAFSREFISAAGCLAFVATSTTPRLLALMSSSILMAGHQSKRLHLSEWSTAALFLALPLLGVRLAGVTGAGLGYFIACLGGMVVGDVMTRRADLPSVSRALMLSRRTLLASMLAVAGGLTVATAYASML